MKQNRFINLLTVGLSTSFILLGPVIAMTAVGYLLDKWLQTGMMIICSIIGFIIGLVLIYRMLMQAEKENLK